MGKYLKTFILFLISIQASTQSLDEQFASANKAYQDGDIAQAITLYESILESGQTSADLYHNLGNAYFNAGNFGKSILNYERGLQLKPNHNAILSNLEIVKSEIDSDIFEVPLFWPVRFWRGFATILPPNAWLLLQILGLILVLGFYFFYWIRPQTEIPSIFRYGRIIGAVLVIISTLCLLTAWRMQYGVQNAIIQQETTLFSGPDDRSESVITIRPGEKVTIRHDIGDWWEVELLNKEVGYIQKNIAEEI